MSERERHRERLSWAGPAAATKKPRALFRVRRRSPQRLSCYSLEQHYALPGPPSLSRTIPRVVRGCIRLPCCCYSISAHLADPASTDRAIGFLECGGVGDTFGCLPFWFRPHKLVDAAWGSRVAPSAPARLGYSTIKVHSTNLDTYFVHQRANLKSLQLQPLSSPRPGSSSCSAICHLGKDLLVVGGST